MWRFFENVPEVADCMPGAELGEERQDGSYSGTLGVKLGPLSLGFQGEAEVDWDEDRYAGQIRGKAVDRKGGSRAQVQVSYRLEEVPEGTKALMEIDLNLSGAAAQFGRTGLVKQVSARMAGQFVDCLEKKLSGSSA
ncbi:MAG: SRPBCC family protein [Actinomycetota bacterium]|nr:SRPBCC family protein [Actinomycetota bacterium]